MRTLRITLIFIVLLLVVLFVVNTLYIPFKNPGAPVNHTVEDVVIPIASGLLVAPFTLRLNRWVERRMRGDEKKKM